MSEKVKPGLAVGAVLLVALGGGTAAVARDGGRQTPGRLDRQGLLEEAASQLGVEPAELRRALLGALGEELDKAVEAGRLTEDQADRIRERAQARGGLPLFGPRGGAFGHRHGGPRAGLLAGAAEYLELSPPELRGELRSGRTLAEVAEAEGKSADGLREALVEAARERLQERVDAGRLSQQRVDRMLSRLSQRIEALVEGRFGGGRQHWGGGRRG